MSSSKDLPLIVHRHSRGPLAYRLPALPDDSSSSKGGNLDVSFQLHLFLRPEEVLLLQLAKDPTLSLKGHTGLYEDPACH